MSEIQRKRMMGNTIRRGKKMPVSAKRAISKSLEGNQRRKGIPHTADIKIKISIGLKKAYAEGRKSIPDIELSRRNISKYNNRKG